MKEELPDYKKWADKNNVEILSVIKIPNNMIVIFTKC